MSASASSLPTVVSGRIRQPAAEPRFFWYAVSLAWAPLLIWQTLQHVDVIAGRLPLLLLWTGVFGLANLMPVHGEHSRYAPDVPIVVAGSILLTPVEIALISFLGAVDPSEFRRTTSFGRALFNRSQGSIASFIGGLVAHWLTRSPSQTQLILLVALAVVAADMAINYFFIGQAMALIRGCSLLQAMRRLQLGRPVDFATTVAAWAVLGALLAVLYNQVHAWALIAFALLSLLGRQLLARSQVAVDAQRASRSSEVALNQISRRIYEERWDERRLIAADLHDEVLQPLFKVTLMAHVLKADLATGRLLDIDEDLPELLSAAEVASGMLRGVIGDLRKSTLGRGGLPRAIESLCRGLGRQHSVSILTEIEAVEVPPPVDLSIYQIAKEALSNAITHGRSNEVSVKLRSEGAGWQLEVRDDGVGFDPMLERAGHYGIQIMRERAKAIGASLFVDSAPNRGCSVVVASGTSQSKTT